MTDKPVFSADWDGYLVKAILSEMKADNGWPVTSEEEIRQYKDSILKDAEAHLFLLPLPIVVQTEQVKQIVTTSYKDKWIRAYPPFPVNERAAAGMAFKDMPIPEGLSRVEKSSTVPNSAVTGVQAELAIAGAQWCRGLRLDVQTGAQGQHFLNRLIEQIAQYTHQWWLRAIHNPFLGPRRLGAEIDQNFNFVTELRYHGAGDIEATWYGVVERQRQLGIGQTLTEDIWITCCELASKEHLADACLVSFLDGIASFMAGRQDQSILQLCIAVEIVANKHRIVIQGKNDEKLDKLIRETPLLDASGREIVKWLMIDRGHVAHGRKPHCLGRRADATMQNYIFTVQGMLNNYLQTLRSSGKWPEAMTTKL